MLVSEIGSHIKLLGFKKTGGSFFYSQDNNIGLINFQKSNSSPFGVVLFTINIGVYTS